MKYIKINNKKQKIAKNKFEITPKLLKIYIQYIKIFSNKIYTYFCNVHYS